MVGESMNGLACRAAEAAILRKFKRESAATKSDNARVEFYISKGVSQYMIGDGVRATWTEKKETCRDRRGSNGRFSIVKGEKMRKKAAGV